jgi:ubiquinone/menaquinone biosynthesis C-methylase UbiE
MNSQKEIIRKRYERFSESYDEYFLPGNPGFEDTLGGVPLARISNDELESMKNISDPKPNEIALDVATGTGKILFALAQAGSKAYGIDFVAGMLKVANRKIHDNQGISRNVQGLVCCDAFSLPFKQCFDLITCMGMTDYYPPKEIEKILGQMKKLLKNDGRIAISFQNKDNALMTEYERTRIERKTNPYKVFTYTLEGIKNIANKVGLKVVQNNIARAGIQIHVLLRVHVTGSKTN